MKYIELMNVTMDLPVEGIVPDEPVYRYSYEEDAYGNLIMYLLKDGKRTEICIYRPNQWKYVKHEEN